MIIRVFPTSDSDTVVGGYLSQKVTGIPVVMDEPIVLPNLETGRDVRKHIQPMHIDVDA
jgi:hypothetical protein